MKYVELLKDVAEGGRDLHEAVKAADSFGLPKHDNHYPRLKVVKKGKRVTEYRKGAIVTMHEAGAEKWVAKGLGKVVAAPKA